MQIPIWKSDLFASVDEADYDLLSKTRWRLVRSRIDSDGYAYGVMTIDGVRTKIFMHRAIMSPPAGLLVDHINGDKLDNRRSNLRICTAAQNMQNSKDRKNNSSGVRGLYKIQHWAAEVTHEKRVFRKTFPFADEGRSRAVAWLEKTRREYHGEFTYTRPSGLKSVT